jgi:uncharacterized protein YciI
MLYAIIWDDVPDSLSLRKEARPAHLEHVRDLVDAGRLVIGGPFPAIDAADPGPAGFDGSLIIAEFPSLDAARQWIADDPYMHKGIIRSVAVKPFVQVVP